MRSALRSEFCKRCTNIKSGDFCHDLVPFNMDKRRRALLFRIRLIQAITRAGSNQSDLARATGVDRSTISQLLRDEGARLPNAHVVGACAEELGVSADWLLGLTEHPENAAELLASALTLTDVPRALVDDQIFNWHREADGYKIRHVPAALPDILKTHGVLDWEYGPHLGRTTGQAITASAKRLAWMRQSASDYEIAMPLFEVQTSSMVQVIMKDCPPTSAVSRSTIGLT